MKKNKVWTGLRLVICIGLIGLLSAPVFGVSGLTIGPEETSCTKTTHRLTITGGTPQHCLPDEIYLQWYRFNTVPPGGWVLVKEGWYSDPENRYYDVNQPYHGPYVLRAWEVCHGNQHGPYDSPEVSVWLKVQNSSSVSATPSTICAGQSTTLSATAEYYDEVWWSDGVNEMHCDCFHRPCEITVSPTTTTTYYTRRRNPTSGCYGEWTPITVTVVQPPNKNLTVSAVTTPICSGGSSTIRVATSESGVTYGLYIKGGAQVGSNKTGNGGNLDFATGTLTSTTQYTVKATRSPCSQVSLNTEPTVTVNPLPGTPTGAQASPGSICIGGSTTLSATPGSGGNQVYWYTGSCGGTQVGVGNQSVSPTSTTKYYARTRNSTTGCWSAGCAEVTVTVVQPPTTASVGGPQEICASGKTSPLGGNTPTVGTGAWSIVSGGTGTFSNASSGSSTFTHTGGAGPVVLRWTISNPPCTASYADVTVTVNAAPSITSHPSSQTKRVGESVTFSVTASGTAPISYQWRKDGSDITDATSSSYTISSITTDHAGSYTCRVTDACGYVTSNAAILTVATEIPALGVPNFSLGGGDWYYDAQTGAGQQGIKDGRGLNNIGLFVRTWGRVTSVGANHFYIDDGSALESGLGNPGVRVEVPAGASMPLEGSYVTVSGASSCYKVGEEVYPCIRVGEESGITVIE